MKSFIQLTSIPDEDPPILHVVIIAGNGLASGSLEFYISTSDIQKTGIALTKFSYSEKSNYSLEIGSEAPEAKFAHYFRFNVFPTGKAYNSYAIQIRLNNNEKLREQSWSHLHQENEFSIETDIDNLKNLGQLLIDFCELEGDFSNRKYRRLYWTPKSGYLETDEKTASPEHYDHVAEAFAYLEKQKNPAEARFIKTY